ncbi:MAG: NAD(P)H-hydrate dehydratase [Candidatus Levyibacteriota bacterium]
MEKFDQSQLKKLYRPQKNSHKGQNGKLMIIGGSHLFHGASLWALKVASRIVDMVFYSSTAENNQLTQELKSKLYDFMAISRDKIDDYIKEADVVLLGSGLPREEGREEREESTRELTQRLLSSYPDKKWVIDAGSLTEMEPEWLLPLKGNVIVTPHKGEFETLFKLKSQKSNLKTTTQNSKITEEIVQQMAGKYNCVILLKGATDIICSPFDSAQGEIRCVRISGGNVGMTKGGTGDVLAGLVAALSCKNDLFLAASAGSFINKKAGESLYEKVGPYFNASDLADEIPAVMNHLINK